MAKPQLEAEPVSISPDGTRDDAWIWEELLGDDDVDEGVYRHALDEDGKMATLEANTTPYLVHLRGATGLSRMEKHDGRKYLVVPVIALMEGVVHAINAPQAEFVSAELLSMAPHQWDGRPVVLGHPTNGKSQISANRPKILEAQGMGFLNETRVLNGKLLTEAWIDIDKCGRLGELGQTILKRLNAGEPVEVSVGAYVNTKSEAGEHNGKKYTARWASIASDHLAFLPNGRGACSIEMGCGALRAAEEATLEVSAAELRTLWPDKRGVDWHGRGPNEGGGSKYSDVGKQARADALATAKKQLEEATQFQKKAVPGSLDAKTAERDIARLTEQVKRLEIRVKNDQTRSHLPETQDKLGRVSESAVKKYERISKAFNSGRPLTARKILNLEGISMSEFRALWPDKGGKDDHGRGPNTGHDPKGASPYTTKHKKDVGSFKYIGDGKDSEDFHDEQSGVPVNIKGKYVHIGTNKEAKAKEVMDRVKKAFGDKVSGSWSYGHVDRSNVRERRAKVLPARRSMPSNNKPLTHVGGPLKNNEARILKETPMTDEQRAALIQDLVTCECSGFTAANIKMLEAASDDDLEQFRANADEALSTQASLKEAQATIQLLQGQITTLSEKKMTEDEFMAAAPASIKTLVAAAQAQADSEKNELVTTLKTCQTVYTEDELKTLEIPQLQKLAKLARVEPSFKGKAVPRVAAASEDFSAPNPWAPKQ